MYTQIYAHISMPAQRRIFKNRYLEKLILFGDKASLLKEYEEWSLALCRIAVFCTATFPILQKDIDGRKAAPNISRLQRDALIMTLNSKCRNHRL